MGHIYLESPPRIKQERSTCWAAAVSAWSMVAKGATPIGVDALIAAGKKAGHVAWKGQLKGDDGIKWLAKKLNLQYATGEFMATEPEMLPKLKKGGHVIYFYRHEDWKNSVHAVTVWGVDEDCVCFMDPAYGQWTFPDPWSFSFKWELCMWAKD